MGGDKTSSDSQSDSKRERRSRDSEAKESSTGYRKPKACVTQDMDTHKRQDTAMVDRWFDRQLNQLYSDVISEPLPKEFIELIEKLREKTPK